MHKCEKVKTTTVVTNICLQEKSELVTTLPQSYLSIYKHSMYLLIRRQTCPSPLRPSTAKLRTRRTGRRKERQEEAME